VYVVELDEAHGLFEVFEPVQGFQRQLGHVAGRSPVILDQVVMQAARHRTPS
jgi:hypothetical protein